MKAKIFIKPAISLVMLFIVFRTIDFSSLKQTFLSISPGIALLVILGYVSGQILSATKWYLIAKNAGIETSYRQTLKAYFIGMFVNCFGFGVIGGDVTRGILMSKGMEHKTPGIASVVADRLHGLVILCMLALISYLIFGHAALDPVIYYLLVGIIFAVILGWFIGPFLMLKIIPESSRFRRKADQLAGVFPTNPGFVLFISGISVFFHLTQIALHGLMAYAVGAWIPWSTLLTRIPIVNILSTLPISWNGLGVREKAYVYFLSPAIISSEQAVALGAIWILSVTCTSLIGGFVALFTKDLKEMKSN